MTKPDISYQRLQNQYISRQKFEKPGDVVRSMGAIQAQDYLQALWAIGLRTQNTSEKDIEQAIADKTIIRTWPMRGTLHFVAAEDIRWMLKLLTPRVISRYRQLVDDTVLVRSKELFIQALQGGKQLTRPEIYDLLERNNISTASQHGYHILALLAQKGVICLGPRKGKQPTFVLLDEWIPPGKDLGHDEALAELAKRYFTSHGPATLYDFATWTGLTITDARSALEMIKSYFVQKEVEGQTYWFSGPATSIKADRSTPFLLPAFDEILCGYKDRSAILNSEHIKSTILKNGIFKPTIIIDGKVAGAWKRTLKKEAVEITTTLFTDLSETESKALTTEAKRYGKFLNLAATLA